MSRSALLGSSGLFLAFVLSPVRAQTPRFGELRRMLPSDADPTQALAVGDVDGDGDLDVFVGNAGQNRLYRNDGSGVFTDATALLPAFLDNTRAVALGDVDGDGDLDALIGNDAQQNRLLLNDGSGGFSPTSQLVAFPENTYAVALGDVDGDGDLDAVIGNFLQPNRLYINLGSGLFTPAFPLFPAVPDNTLALALGDLDGDGDLDAFVGNDRQQNRLYRNNGSGLFSESFPPLPGTFDGTRAVALGDVDGDGDLDAFVANTLGEQHRLYLNDGSGALTDAMSPLPTMTEGGQGIALGDVDGDGDLDALFANLGADRLLLNDGSGFFVHATPPLPSLPDSAASAALADLDGDGDLDLLLGNRALPSGQQNRLYLNDGSGVFVDATSPLPPILDDTRAVALGDLDGDGDLDALVANAGPNRLLRNDGSGVFADATSPLPAPLDDSRGLALGDVDGDGDLDVLVGNHGQSRLLVNDGSGVLTDAPSQIPGLLVNTCAVALGDVDGDGDLDAFLGNVGPCGLAGCGTAPDRLYSNDGSGVFADASGNLPPIAGRTASAALGDVDGDGDLDLVLGTVGSCTVFGCTGAQNRLLLNDGAGTFTEASNQLPVVLDWTEAVALADVDGDSDLDALFGNGSGVGIPGEQNRLVLNDGSGVFLDATSQIPAVSDKTRAIALGDVDEDGDLDLLFGNLGQDRLYLNDGSGLFADATADLPPLSERTCALAWGDVDGDGDLDAWIGTDEQDRLLSNRTRQLARRGIPRIGKPLAFDVFGPPWGAWFLGFSTGTAGVPIPPLGTLRLDPSNLVVTFASLLDAEGRASISHSVPADPTLLGMPIHWQALVVGPARFTNLETTTLTDL